MITKKELLKTLKTQLSEYSSIPFWSWNNELEKSELLRQVNEFKAQSIDAFIIHARTGLKTEYMGEKWFDCIDACIQEAAKLNIKVWLYDENGWPSGFAGGELLKEQKYLAKYIEYEKKDYFDKSADAVYIFRKGGAVRLLSADNSAEYHCLYIKTSPAYADILNKNTVDGFIAKTHEKYYLRFQEYFGNIIEGFFTDEAQYYRSKTPFSDIIPEEYSSNYGEDIFDGLIYLFLDGVDSEIFRYRYYALLNRLYTDNFYKNIYDWCDAHNCKLTGHSVEESGLAGQLWGSAGVMPSYEYEHIPAIDWLCRQIDSGVSARQAGSVAQQSDKKFVLSEMFGCSGWDTTPREMRRIAEFQYINGVNLMCQHLAAYSLKGQAKGDYPPAFSRHNLWTKDSKDFNEYFKRLSYILCNTKEQANTLVIHPLHSAYLTYKRIQDFESVKKLETDFFALDNRLIKEGVQFHYGDECIINKYGRIEGKRFVVGSCYYDYVIVPDMDNIDKSTERLITEFFKAGGRVICPAVPSRIDARESLCGFRGNCGIDEIRRNFVITGQSRSSLIFSHRYGEAGEFVYIMNASENDEVSFDISADFDILELERPNITAGGNPVTLRPMTSILLMPKNASYQSEKIEIKIITPEERTINITDNFRFLRATENCLTVDYVNVSYDGQYYSDAEFVHSVNERLIKSGYSGKLWLKYIFDVEGDATAKIRYENMNYDSVQLNGITIAGNKSEWDILFSESEVMPLRTGKNEFTVCVDYYQGENVCDILYNPEVPESLKNCVVIDTEIDSIYLLGDFIVLDRTIKPPCPINKFDKLNTRGFHNFAGDIFVSGQVELDNTNYMLRLSGRFMAAEVTVNNICKKMILSDTLDISNLLKKGDNNIDIRITSGMRNMLGPHHFKTDEPTAVGHYHFDFRGTWQDGKAPDFTSEYKTVDFGLDKICLITKAGNF